MPSSLSHAMIAVAAGAAIAPRTRLCHFLILGAVCAVAPDIDAIGRLLPVDDGDIELLGGHRGFTHSLAFAGLAGAIVATATLASRAWNRHRIRLMLFIFLATATHGALDAMTSIGAATSPVQFFSPFSTRGYTAPWHPIHGPFGELLLCLLPLFLITQYVWHARGLPRRSLDSPLSIGFRDYAAPPAAGGTHIKRWIVFGLLVLVAFWGWRSEARRADRRREHTTESRGAGRPGW